MPTESTIDLNALLAPISEESPAGTDPRLDPRDANFFKIRDARNTVKAIERQMDAEEEPAGGLPAEWRTILDLAPKVLTSRAKDLDTATWYTEALLRYYGFPGLRDGFLLICGMIEQHWDGLTPVPDEGEDRMETLLNTLAGLNGAAAEGTLIQPIRKVPITNGTEGPYAFWQYNQAIDLAKITDNSRRQARIDAGQISWDAFEKEVRETDGAFFKTLLQDVEGCLAAFERMSGLLYEKAEDSAPSAGNIRGVLTGVIDAIKHVARDKLALAAQADADAAAVATANDVSGDATAAAGGGAPARGGAGGPISTRDDAFRVLLQVADFFRRNEPHSPISYTLEEVVRRGRLTLPELLMELIDDEEKRRFFFIASGVKPPEPAEE